MAKQINLAAVLGEGLAELLFRVGKYASSKGNKAFLVGGAVRDLLLNQASADIDIMLEVQGPDFARALKADWRKLFAQLSEPSKIVVFSRYQTAKLLFKTPILGGITQLDFASARKEFYPVAAQAPEIVFGDLREDYIRRDFTVNALAVCLNEFRFGELVDEVDGEKDIRAKHLRVMHSASFIDDPARIIRGIRFAARFGFQFEAETSALVAEAIAAERLKQLPAARRFDEFRKAFSEADVLSVLRALDAYGLFPLLHHQLVLSPQVMASLDSIDRVASQISKEIPQPAMWQLVLVLLCKNLPTSSFEELLRTASFSRNETKTILELRQCILNLPLS